MCLWIVVGFERMQIGIQFVFWRESSSRLMYGLMIGSDSLYWRLEMSTSCCKSEIGLI